MQIEALLNKATGGAAPKWAVDLFIKFAGTDKVSALNADTLLRFSREFNTAAKKKGLSL